MTELFKEFKFRWTYDIASKIRKVVEENPIDYYLTDYFRPSEEQFIARITKPRKETLLHDFLKTDFILDIEYMTHKFDYYESIEEFEATLELYNIPFLKLRKNASREKVYDHLHYLEELMQEKASQFIVEEAFNLLFSNRLFLLQLNTVISDVIRTMKRKDYPSLLKSDGVINRCSYIPRWLENAIFHRDKGRCVLCGKDLTRIFNLSNDYQFDHIVPLSKGGTNDPINFQLLCGKCNQSKSNVKITTSEKYLSYW